MACVWYSTKLCDFVVSNQQKELLDIFDSFSTSVSMPQHNIFFRQNEILDKMLINIEKCKRNIISSAALYKGISEQELKIIKPLDLDNKLLNDTSNCKILGIDYFDQDKFMSILDNALDVISTKYNLNGDDDYNKLHKFLSSIKLMLQSSDNMLNTLANQYALYKEHSGKKSKDEFIMIYDHKHYKSDIIDNLVSEYIESINDNLDNKQKNKRGTR